MKKLLVVLGSLLAGCSALIFLSERQVNRRQSQKIPAVKAAAMLQEAWADHHTRA